jgi:hypothetical protein
MANGIEGQKKYDLLKIVAFLRKILAGGILFFQAHKGSYHTAYR